MPFIIFYLLVFLVACASGYEPTAVYRSENSSCCTSLAYMGTLPSSEEEEPAVFASLLVSMTNGSAFNPRPDQIPQDSFLGTGLTWIKSIGNEIKLANVSFPKAGGLSWGFLFNQTKKMEAMLDIVAAIIGPYSKKWENRIKIVKALLRGLVAFFGE